MIIFKSSKYNVVELLSKRLHWNKKVEIFCLGMILCKVLLVVIFIKLCVSQNTTCSAQFTDYWTSNWEKIKENKKMFFVLSRSTNVLVDNYTELLTFGIDILTPIIFRPLQSSEIYELSVTSNFKFQKMYFVSVFKGNLTFKGIYRETFNQTEFKLDTYVFETEDSETEVFISLFHTCQLTMDAMERIHVQKAIILFVSVPTELQRLKIATNITSYIRAANMKDYIFYEFKGKRIESCEVLRNHLMKCKAEVIISDFRAVLVPAFLLALGVIAAVKSFCCVREIMSSRVYISVI